MEKTILVVDDEPMTRNLLRIILKRAGFAVREAGDGLEALESIAEERPVLVILDVMMPNLDGIAACRKLRESADTADLPVIILSAKTQYTAVQEGMEAGASRYMTKPIAPDTLVTCINELLAESPESAVHSTHSSNN